MINKFLYINIFIILFISCSDRDDQFGGYNDPSALDGIELKDPLGIKIPLDTEIYFNQPILKKRTMGDLLGNGIPKLFIFGYYDCPMLCNSIRDNLFSELNKTDLKLGYDYEILMLSIDYNEDVEKASNERDLYFNRYFTDNKPEDKEYINFMVSTEKQIDKITKALGFEYKYDSELDQFFHPAFIYIISDYGIVTSGLQMGAISDIINTEIAKAKNNTPSMNFSQFYTLTCIQKDIENKNPNNAFRLIQFAGIWFISSLSFYFGYNFLVKKESGIEK